MPEPLIPVPTILFTESSDPRLPETCSAREILFYTGFSRQRQSATNFSLKALENSGPRTTDYVLKSDT